MTAVGVYRSLASATHAPIRSAGRWWRLVAAAGLGRRPAELVQPLTFTNSPLMPALVTAWSVTARAARSADQSDCALESAEVRRPRTI